MWRYFTLCIRKQFYQAALGNCHGLQLPKWWLQLKNEFIVSFIIIFGTLSFPVDSATVCMNLEQSNNLSTEITVVAWRLRHELSTWIFIFLLSAFYWTFHCSNFLSINPNAITIQFSLRTWRHIRELRGRGGLGITVISVNHRYSAIKVADFAVILRSWRPNSR